MACAAPTDSGPGPATCRDGIGAVPGTLPFETRGAGELRVASDLGRLARVAGPGRPHSVLWPDSGARHGGDYGVNEGVA